MELYKREFLISRIRSGYVPIYVDKRRLLVHNADDDIILHANEIYIREYEKAIEEELLQDEDIYDILIANGIWSEEKEKELNDIVPKHIEYWKKELYKSVLKSNTRKTVRKYLDAAKEELIKLHNDRHIFDYVSCAGYASYIKNIFIISKTTRYKNKRVNWSKFDINKVMNIYHNNVLDSDTIRLLSRTSPWSSIWPILKLNGSIFNNHNLTLEQQILMSWSMMYDKIYESPDCPPDEVIEDDDMLDGWLLIQREKREQDRKKQEVENATSSKITNADDIFVMAETLEDAKKIDLLNDNRASRIKRQRLAQIKDKGAIYEQSLPDMQQRQRMLLQQAYIQQVKGK